MQRAFTNILTEEVAVTAAFYQQLLGYTAKFSSDWFVNLEAPDQTGLELVYFSQAMRLCPRPLGINPQASS
jgi:hypothetical protein